MIKRTLFFENPAYLSLKDRQLLIRKPGSNPALSDKGLSESDKKSDFYRTIPIEDIGIVILDNKQITLTQALLNELNINNCAVITCNSSHLPSGMFLPLDVNSIQNERFRTQLDASIPLKKQLWQQTVIQKIKNQASILEYSTGEMHNNMFVWANSVKSGDTGNLEARAAAYYWKNVFPGIKHFTRDRAGDGPNVLLNFGYSILRAIIARALVSSGLLPTIGIHHHNKYNAYCLADDIMEPYRPYVDKLVVDILKDDSSCALNTNSRHILLEIPTIEVIISGKRSPLSVAATTTTASLYKCFDGEMRKIIYPEIPDGQV